MVIHDQIFLIGSRNIFKIDFFQSKMQNKCNIAFWFLSHLKSLLKNLHVHQNNMMYTLNIYNFYLPIIHQ